MWKWFKKNWPTIFGGIGTLIVGALIGHFFPTRSNNTSISNENTNSGHQQAVFNQGDINQQTNVQNQSIPPQDLVKELKDSGKTEYILAKTEKEKQQLLKELGLYKSEDKDIRESLIKAENNEKYELTAMIWYEYVEGRLTKDKALKLSDMVNRAYWKDLKNYFDKKNIRIDETNQSLVFAGIFEPKAEGGGGRLDRLGGGASLIYELTTDGNKLYEIANKHLSKKTPTEK